MGLVWWNIRSYKMHLRQLKLRRGPSMCHFQLSFIANNRKQLRNQSGRISLHTSPGDSCTVLSWTNETMFNVVVPCLYHSVVYFYTLQTDYLWISSGVSFQGLFLQVTWLVGGDKWLYVESVIYHSKNTDSLRNKISDCVYKWVIKLFTQPIY